jgi:hypothetical protein
MLIVYMIPHSVWEKNFMNFSKETGVCFQQICFSLN